MAGDPDGLLDGDGLANTLDNDIDVADALLLQAGRDVLVDGINCQVGAEFERNLALAFDGLEQDNLGGAGVFSKLHHEQADHAAADDDNRAAGLDVAHIDAVQTARHGLGHGALLEAGVIAQLVDLLHIDGAVLGKAAVNGGAVTGHMLAVVVDSVAAGFAAAAGMVWVDAHAIARFKASDVAAHGLDNARKLMTKDRGRGNVGCTLVAFIDMNVGTADAASFDVDQNVAPAHGRLCRFLDSEVVLSIEDRAFHGDSLTWR